MDFTQKPTNTTLVSLALSGSNKGRIFNSECERKKLKLSNFISP